MEMPIGGVKKHKRCVVDHMIIDPEDYNLASQYKWTKRNGYASVSVKRQTLYFHRLVLNVTDKEQFIDHINGNKLDNRKCNLRVTNRTGNQQNRRGPNRNNQLGVLNVYKHGDYFATSLNHNKKVVLSKCFDSLEDAQEAVRKKRIELNLLSGALNDQTKFN